MQTNKFIYNIFSGQYLEILEEDVKNLYNGQIPLKTKPNYSCKKCYGKGHLGRDLNNFTYQLCSCVRKIVDIELLKKDMS
jgi:hypothetical protein